MSASLQQQILAAGTAVAWLAEHGHSVTRIEISAFITKPRIRLSNRPTNIHSVECSEMSEGKTRRYREATIAGCRIEWEV